MKYKMGLLPGQKVGPLIFCISGVRSRHEPTGKYDGKSHYLTDK